MAELREAIVLMIGVLIGAVAFMLVTVLLTSMFGRAQAATRGIIIERDQEGRITAIHYV
ncbi:MAG: hypothetical protein QW599_05570 [Nitrososphaerota archaeon]